ncbi:MAG: HAMP domain-containing histidine kinase [Flavobacteriaceae bacterium]|nr:HAMP domain-containing histidine kinase [Bacteroidia bacterium]NNL61298.1 HAMP domain-containing histidine kinase [Flavobacteriaceae bacterium]
MQLTNNKNAIRWLMIMVSFFIISLILWNTYRFFQSFKEEERMKMRIWSYAYPDLLKNTDLEQDIGELPIQVIQGNTSTPMVLVDLNGKVISSNNLSPGTEEKLQDSVYVSKLLNRFKNEYMPIEVKVDGKVVNTIYYGNSELLNKLKFYPMALLLIILLFAAVVYFFYRSSRIAAQNKLWTGMAKETAHQIGTPLSSLVGWTEILKSENVNPEYITEIEKDITRLQTITDRFSKVGSLPKLERRDIVKETKESYTYLKSRTSDLINFDLDTPNESLYVECNPQLLSWTIENLVKNAIDAMKGKGNVSVKIFPKDKYVNINITDTGKGLPKALYKKVFEPGFTSKKRGWGLGLSLAKRIVEEYHNGKIRVLSSEIGKGTTMQISLRMVP